MIQVIKLSKGIEEAENNKKMRISEVDRIGVLDDYDINIIDMNDEEIWYEDFRISNISCLNHLETISRMIDNSSKTDIMILLPQNIDYGKNGISRSQCGEKRPLRDMIADMKRIITYISNVTNYLDINYGTTTTKVGEHVFDADFYFCENLCPDGMSYEVLCKSSGSELSTVVSLTNNNTKRTIYFCTLNIGDYCVLPDFLKSIGVIKTKCERPDWMSEIEMFDDREQKDIITSQNSIIENAEKTIEKANNILLQNNRYKSILYTSGEELVFEVFNILNEMLGIDLRSFVDEKREDFRFEVDGIAYLGEIKGVNENVKSKFISQLEQHKSEYMDEHPEKDDDHIRAILIINYQRNKAIQDRDPIHERQIKQAEKYDSLIIDSGTLLKIFERFKAHRINREECLRLFSNVGVLCLD